MLTPCRTRDVGRRRFPALRARHVCASRLRFAGGRLGISLGAAVRSNKLAQKFACAQIFGFVEQSLRPPVFENDTAVREGDVAAVSQAHPIPCVTGMQAIPSPASSLIVLSASPTVSGSNAAATPSNSITSGFIASGRAMETLCCRSPDPAHSEPAPLRSLSARAG